jgi:hypothetical protein
MYWEMLRKENSNDDSVPAAEIKKTPGETHRRACNNGAGHNVSAMKCDNLHRLDCTIAINYYWEGFEREVH